MIQRRQILCLVLIIALFVVLFFVPLFELVYPGSNPIPRFMQTHLIIFALGLLIAGFALLAIVVFRKRKLQIVLCYFGVVFSVLFSALIFMLSNFAKFLPYDDGQIHFTGAWLTFLFPLLFLFAVYFIKKDENLVKAADRLR